MYIHVLFSSQTDHARAMHEVILRYPRGPPGTRAQGEIRNYDIGQYPVSLGLDSITPALARRTDFPRDQSYHTPTPWGLLDRGRTNPMARKGGRNKRGIKITETAAGRWGHGFFGGLVLRGEKKVIRLPPRYARSMAGVDLMKPRHCDRFSMMRLAQGGNRLRIHVLSRVPECKGLHMENASTRVLAVSVICSPA